MSSQEIPQAPATPEKEPALKKFRAKVEKYLDWQDSLLSDNRPNLKNAEERKGQTYNVNIYQTPDGQIWEMGTIGKPGGGYYGGGYWPRGNRDAAQKDLPEGAVRANFDGSDNWAWETLKAHNDRVTKDGWWNLAINQDEFTRLDYSLKRMERDKSFAQNIIDNWDKVEEWARLETESGNTFTHNDIDRNWSHLMAYLHLDEIDHADPTAMQVALTESLNELITGKPNDLGVSY